MQNKTKIICFEGASASSRREQDTLSGFIDIINDGARPMTVIDSVLLNPNDIVPHVTLFAQGYEDLLLVGKSLGAIKLWWALSTFFCELELPGSRVSTILIDPHGPIWGDGQFGAYGNKRHPKIEYNEKWNRDDTHMHCFYQLNDFIKGARFDNDKFNTKLEYADHFNITDINSVDGTIVANKIREELSWLEN